MLQTARRMFALLGAVIFAARGVSAKQQGSFETDSAVKTYKVSYGMAGCGLGSVVFKKNQKTQQILATLFNSTGLQSLSIASSQSSNCAPSYQAAQAEQRVFIAANLSGLAVDFAAGGGDYSLALAQVLGCHEGADYNQFLAVGRSHYRQIFASPDPEQVYQALRLVLGADAEMAQRCERLALDV